MNPLWARLGSALHNSGDDKAALDALAEAEKAEASYWYVRYVRCCVLAKAELIDKAFESLAVATTEPAYLRLFEAEPDLATLRRDPRYRSTMANATANTAAGATTND